MIATSKKPTSKKAEPKSPLQILCDKINAATEHQFNARPCDFGWLPGVQIEWWDGVSVYLPDDAIRAVQMLLLMQLRNFEQEMGLQMATQTPVEFYRHDWEGDQSEGDHLGTNVHTGPLPRASSLFRSPSVAVWVSESLTQDEIEDMAEVAKCQVESRASRKA